MSLKRKLKREVQKTSQKEFTKKVGLFDKIPDLCLTCNKEFDKKNREMVMTWNVVVNRQKEQVRLYCPQCWDKARRLIEEIKDGYSNTNGDV
tara:strand:+ start:2293 stop:2568 length:276 start_codon:yes stop_codon:yes gene_type:complete